MQKRYMHTLARLGEVIREERLAQDLSLEALGLTASVSPDFLQETEDGQAPSDFSAINRILNVLGIFPLALPGELLYPREHHATT